jgi:hypothetical protein
MVPIPKRWEAPRKHSRAAPISAGLSIGDFSLNCIVSGRATTYVNDAFAKNIRHGNLSADKDSRHAQGMIRFSSSK